MKENGKKLDQPTPESVARLYSWGKELRERFLEYEIVGTHSEAGRTYISVTSVLMGAGVTPVYSHLTETAALNVLAMTPVFLAQVRNMADIEERNRLIFDDYRRISEEAGTRIASHLVRNLQSAIEQEGRVVNVSFSHGPPLDAAYLSLIREPISYDNVVKHTGGISVESGFDLGLRRDGHLDVVDIKLPKRSVKTYSLAELAELK